MLRLSRNPSHCGDSKRRLVPVFGCGAPLPPHRAGVRGGGPGVRHRGKTASSPDLLRPAQVRDLRRRHAAGRCFPLSPSRCLRSSLKYRHDPSLELRRASRRPNRKSIGLGHISGPQAAMPYQYGIMICMKKTLHIDEHLLRDAKSASGAKTDTDTVRLGLEALVRRGAYERLRALRGSEPQARDVRRRREPARSARHSAA